MNEKKKILLVMPTDAQVQVMRGLSDPDLCFCLAGSCEEARSLYRTGLPAAVDADLVIVALTLEDGNWMSVYQELVTRSAPSDVIVALPEGAGDPAPLAPFGVANVIRPPYDSLRCRDVVLRALERRQVAAGVR